MDISILGAAAEALHTLADPLRLLLLVAGVLLGLFLGIIPGIGGLAGMALLLPFTFTMDPYAAFAMLLGMSAVTGTSDTLPAVLFGVPGTGAAQATVMDGAPMAKNGEAGRALSAAFTASLIGGLCGAALLALTVPVLRPIMLRVGSPELFAFSVFGLSMVAVLSGSAPLRGMVAASLGVLLSMVGSDPQTGTLRYVVGSFYLWDGLPIVPIVLGLFALPELADLAIRRTSIASTSRYDTKAGMVQGVKDVFNNLWLVLRCGGIGAAVGAIPGMGSSVVDWLAYGHAHATVKDSQKTFGKGDVRGVIAPESANNSINAGALVPTIAFGVPGSATMAILLSVFMIHGLVPGPQMLSQNLDVTYTMIWSIALANIFGAGICFLFSGQLAKIALLRYTLVLPPVMVFVYIGAFQASRNWGDLYALLIFAVLGWVMKQLRWPRPPLILGFVLGALIERYMFISSTRYGWEWLGRPIVATLLIASVALLILPMVSRLRALGGASGIRQRFSAPQFALPDLFYLPLFALLAWMAAVATTWAFAAKVGPLAVSCVALVACALSFLGQIFSRAILAARRAEGEEIDNLHMDTVTDHSGTPVRTVLTRAAIFLGFLVGFTIGMATIGLLLTVPVFVFAFMRLQGREKWTTTTAQAAGIMIMVYIIFDRLLSIPWPQTLLGTWFPELTAFPTI